VLFYAYMPMLLCDCQSFKESYLVTCLLASRKLLLSHVLFEFYISIIRVVYQSWTISKSV